jgi:aryl-alcohol dehydrogenase-like predicted oxidoreductase
MDASLKRLQLEYVDLVYCHRPDPNTPIEETVWAMSDMIVRGKAQYWGTSEWSATEIRAAWDIAEKHHLHKPIVEQPEYNLFHRERVEEEYAPLYKDIGIGLTTWSPLASGVLTGKYRKGIPEGSRGSITRLSFMKDLVGDKAKAAAVDGLEPIANELGCTLAQLSLAWCLKNPNVSTVITGASRVSQVEENLKAIDIAPKLTPDVMARIEKATSGVRDSS